MTIRRHGRVADLTWLLDHRHDLGRHRLGAGSEVGVAIRQLWYPAREAAWSTLALHYSTVRVGRADLSKESCSCPSRRSVRMPPVPKAPSIALTLDCPAPTPKGSTGGYDYER